MVGLDSLVKVKILSNRNIKEQSLASWKSSILEKINQKVSKL